MVQMNSSLFLKNADVIVTMDTGRRELRGGSIHVVGDQIAAIGTDLAVPDGVDDVIDLTGHLVCPGLINTHHHMFQSLTRVIPGAQNGSLFGWLQTLYPIWSGLTPEMVRISTQTAMAELLMGGCTTSSDHLYLFPNGSRLDDSIEGARQIGMRFHASRGSMSIGESLGGLPPDVLVENESEILRDSERVIDAFHDPRPRSMLRVVLAPCSPFSVSRELMRDSALLARERGVSLHTHLAENSDDVSYSLERFSRTPAQYAEDLGWLGPDVWHAHCVHLDAEGIDLFGRTRTGVAHCPCSNMRLGSGIAPVIDMLRAGVPVGIGVDGSASNDSGDMLGELRQAMLLQRVQSGAGSITARQVIELGTLGGASVLGRDDIGELAPGMAADIAAFDLRSLPLAGALHDPVAALIFCGPLRSAYTVVNGQVVVREGRLETLNLEALCLRHNALARKLLDD